MEKKKLKFIGKFNKARICELKMKVKEFIKRHAMALLSSAFGGIFIIWLIIELNTWNARKVI